MDPSSAAQEEQQESGPFFGLPETVLVSILQRLPQHDRLACAALVCKPWAAAAAAATPLVVVTARNAAAAGGLGSWVQQHGKGVEAIRVTVPKHLDGPLMLKLPSAGLAKLAELQLLRCTLEFSSSSAEQGGSAAVLLPALSSLTLRSCTVSLDTLSLLECPKVTGLQLVYPPSEWCPADMQQQLDTALSALLQRLPMLELLQLGHSHASDAALATLSCLQQLQHCSLWCPSSTPALLGNLPTGLTSLTLTRGRGLLQEEDLPAAGWPHLKQLTVSCRAVQPALLSRLTTLERLSLSTCRLTNPLTVNYSSEAAEAVEQLLAALAQLTNLKQLCLTNIDILAGVWQGPQPEGAAAAARLSPFSALTASSQLESLTLAFRGIGGDTDYSYPNQPIPQGTAVQMFPPGRQLTALTELVLDAMDIHLLKVIDQYNHYYTNIQDDPFNIDTCVAGSDLQLLLAACPKLQRLTLNSVLGRRCDELQPFLGDVQNQLQLSYLCLGGLCLTDDEAEALAGITGLRELELHNAPELRPEGIAHLTALRQLSRLLLNKVGCLRGISCSLRSKPQSDQPGVWQQLERELPGMRAQQSRLQHTTMKAVTPPMDGSWWF